MSKGVYWVSERTLKREKLQLISDDSGSEMKITDIHQLMQSLRSLTEGDHLRTSKTFVSQALKLYVQFVSIPPPDPFMRRSCRAEESIKFR